MYVYWCIRIRRSKKHGAGAQMKWEPSRLLIKDWLVILMTWYGVCVRESVRGRVCESAFVCVCVDIIDQGRICEINNVIRCLWEWQCVHVCVCVCVCAFDTVRMCERECVRMCVSVRLYVCVSTLLRKDGFVKLITWYSACVSERERELVCVCVCALIRCVCVRESVWESVWVCVCMCVCRHCWERTDLWN